MYDGPTETTDYMWAKIWYMLHAKLDCWILSQNCRNTPPREKTSGFFRKSNLGFHDGSSLSQPPCCQLILSYKLDSLFCPTTTV